MLYDQIASRFRSAQRTLARIQGVAAEGGGTNVLILGAPYVGVFGAAQMDEVIAVGGGIRRVAVLPLTITRDQIASVDGMHKKALIRTDMSPSITYEINSINDNDPHHFAFMLVKNGE